MSYDKIASEIKRLHKKGKLKAKDLAEWLKSRGVEIQGRPTIDNLIATAKRSRKVKISDLVEFLEEYERESEEYEREIIIREKGKRVKESARRRASRKSEYAVETSESAPILDLALELWPGLKPNQLLAQIYSVLEEAGIRYKKAKNITDLISKLGDSERVKLYNKLLELKSWREFQNQVYNWVKANIPLAHEIIDNGGIFEQEYVEHGDSGVNYRFDVYGYYEESGFLSSYKALVIVEAKKYSDPINLDQVLIFRGKALDMLVRFWPDDAFFAIFSESGFTDRAIKYVKRWGVYNKPLKLYERRGKGFVLIAETDEKYLK